MNKLSMQLLLSEFDGSNHQQLATKYNTHVRTIYRVIRLAVQNAMREALQASAENHLEILWVDQTDKLARLNGCVAVLEAAQKALDSHRLDHAAVALVALPLTPPPAAPGSNLGGSSSASAKTQQGTPSQTSLYPSSSSLSPFTQFLGRLVGLVGAENAAKLTREFAGQTLRFPITDHYDTTARNDFGFPAVAPILGADYVRSQSERTTHSLRSEPHHLTVQENASSVAQPPSEGRAPSCSSQVSPQCAAQPESTHLTGPSEIGSLSPDLSGS